MKSTYLPITLSLILLIPLSAQASDLVATTDTDIAICEADYGICAIDSSSEEEFFILCFEV